MSTETKIDARPGQVWSKGDRLALVVKASHVGAGGTATMRGVTGNTATGRPTHVKLINGRPNGYTFHHELPKLRCVSAAQAANAADFLREQGVTDCGWYATWVWANLAVPTVIHFAEDAFEQGFADDAECAAMIGRLG